MTFPQAQVDPTLEYLQNTSFHLGVDLEALYHVEVQRRGGNVLSFQDSFPLLPDPAPGNDIGIANFVSSSHTVPDNVADPWDYALFQANLGSPQHTNSTLARNHSTPVSVSRDEQVPSVPVVV